MHDEPKAVHFKIYESDNVLNPESAQRIRWALAKECRDFGIHDMLNLTTGQHLFISSRCAEYNKGLPEGIAIQLDVDYLVKKALEGEE